MLIILYYAFYSIVVLYRKQVQITRPQVYKCLVLFPVPVINVREKKKHWISFVFFLMNAVRKFLYIVKVIQCLIWLPSLHILKHSVVLFLLSCYYLFSNIAVPSIDQIHNFSVTKENSSDKQSSSIDIPKTLLSYINKTRGRGLNGACRSVVRSDGGIKR